MGIYSDVECWEEWGTLKEEFSDRLEPSATVTLRCAAANRFALCTDILVNRRMYPGGVDLVTPPIALSATLQPDQTTYTASGQAIVYPWSLVTIKYGMPPKADEDDNGQLFSETLEPNVEFLTLDHKRFRWNAADGDPLLEAEAPGRIMRSMNLNRTIYKVASLPGTILSACGKCNATGYTSSILGLTFPAETLLYCPPTLSRSFTSSGSEGWDVNLKFMYKESGWNRYWRAKTQQFEKIFLAGGGEYKNYPTGSFAGLLG